MSTDDTWGPLLDMTSRHRFAPMMFSPVFSHTPPGPFHLKEKICHHLQRIGKQVDVSPESTLFFSTLQVFSGILEETSFERHTHFLLLISTLIASDRMTSQT